MILRFVKKKYSFLSKKNAISSEKKNPIGQTLKRSREQGGVPFHPASQVLCSPIHCPVTRSASPVQQHWVDRISLSLHSISLVFRQLWVFLRPLPFPLFCRLRESSPKHPNLSSGLEACSSVPFSGAYSPNITWHYFICGQGFSPGMHGKP